ncbi:hypothetical protein AYI68_g7231 [Smittium mucronatum]|uniref:Uncharacterized protein n=1 Tax=Smittium mucronatum TaxID=133383 RepID=A0A1R0GPA3_9FUNG|nr:hypothetical protein AYI68_g7231 [Smittium mucronatum]
MRRGITEICSGEKGTILIKFMFKRLKLYLYDNRFVVETCAKSVLGMLSKVDLPSEVSALWVAYLKMYDFYIVKICGKESAVADALSRFSNEDMEVETLSIIKNTHKTPKLPEERNEEMLRAANNERGQE